MNRFRTAERVGGFCEVYSSGMLWFLPAPGGWSGGGRPFLSSFDGRVSKATSEGLVTCLLELGDWYVTSNVRGGPKWPQVAEWKAVLGKVIALPLTPWGGGGGLKEYELWVPGMPSRVSLKQVPSKRALLGLRVRGPQRENLNGNQKLLGRWEQPAREVLPKSWEIQMESSNGDSSRKPQKQLKEKSPLTYWPGSENPVPSVTVAVRWELSSLPWPHLGRHGAVGS